LSSLNRNSSTKQRKSNTGSNDEKYIRFLQFQNDALNSRCKAYQFQSAVLDKELEVTKERLVDTESELTAVTERNFLWNETMVYRENCTQVMAG
jgi:hypothetical protein